MDSIQNRRERSFRRLQNKINLFIEYYENHKDSISDKEIVEYRKVAEIVSQQVAILSEGIEKEMKLALKLAKRKETENAMLRKAVAIGLEALAQAEAEKARKGKINLLEVPKKVLAFVSSFINKP